MALISNEKSVCIYKGDRDKWYILEDNGSPNMLTTNYIFFIVDEKYKVIITEKREWGSVSLPILSTVLILLTLFIQANSIISSNQDRHQENPNSDISSTTAPLSNNESTFIPSASKKTENTNDTAEDKSATTSSTGGLLIAL